MAKTQLKVQSKTFMLRLVADCLDAKPQHPFLWRDSGTGEYYDGLKSDLDLKHVDHVKLGYVRPDDSDLLLVDPTGLTADQIGVGYRLPIYGETSDVEHETWRADRWDKAPADTNVPFECLRSTCRIRSSVPYSVPSMDMRVVMATAHPEVWKEYAGIWSYKYNSDWLMCRSNDPFEDLNALHEMEKAVSNRLAYRGQLFKVVRLARGKHKGLELATCAERQQALINVFQK